MKQMSMNEVQDLLEELNACTHEALEALAKGDLVGCKTALKALADELGQQLEGEDD